MDRNQANFQRLDNKIGQTLLYEGKQYVFFGGAAYLGINANAEAQRLYIAGIQKYGFNVGTSRGNNVQLGIYSKAEKFLADWFGFESGLVASSGFLVTQLAARVLAEKAPILYAPGAHPALWLQSTSPSPAITFATWAVQTVDYINKSADNVFVVASDTFASVLPSYYDFSPFEAVDKSKQVYFLLDHSHGFGVCDNPSVTGLKRQNRPNFHFVLVGSLAKGLGIDAGVVLGESDIVEQFRESAMFAGASPPSPAAMYLLTNGEELYRDQWEQLQHRMKWFEASICAPYRSVPGFPVYCFDDPELYDRLLDNGIVISHFSYPTAKDPLLQRVVLNSEHGEEDIATLVRVINKSKHTE